VHAADVMMGHDPDCARWIRRFREVPPLQASGAAAVAGPAEGTARGRREAGTGGASRVLHDDKDPSAWVVFTPSGKRRPLPARHTAPASAGAWASTSTRCAAARAVRTLQVLVMEGDFPKHGVSSMPRISPPERGRAELLPTAPLPAGHRLSCSHRSWATWSSTCLPAARCTASGAQAVEAHPITLDPVVHLHYVEVREPDMHDPSGDLQRLLEALHASGNSARCAATLRCCRVCRRRCARANGKSPSRCMRVRNWIGVWPGFHDRIYGLAVDVGSTTIAAHLCNLETGEVVASSGAMNPQIRFGEAS